MRTKFDSREIEEHYKSGPMFTHAKCQLVFDALIHYMEKNAKSILANDIGDALNIVMRCAKTLATESAQNTKFRRWLDSCAELFERNCGAVVREDDWHYMKRMVRSTDMADKNDQCERCGKQFDFPEDDLMVLEKEGEEVLCCNACGERDAFQAAS